MVPGRGPVIAVREEVLPQSSYLLKAHLDFLMMTGLLFIFFLVFEHLELTPPMGIVVAMSVGSMGNPSGFLRTCVQT